LTDWGLTAISAQTGYIVPFISMLQLNKTIQDHHHHHHHHVHLIQVVKRNHHSEH